jgi:hypothetical protein
MGMESWVRRYHMERLAKDAHKTIDNLVLDLEANSAYCVDLGLAKLPDGRNLNFQDPALAKFMQFVRALTHTRVECLLDVEDALRSTFLGPGKNIRFYGTAFAFAERIFDFQKAEGGWDELDRLIHYISGKSMTERASHIHRQIRYCPEDPGLGGNVTFTLEYEFFASRVIADKVVFGSKPQYVLAFLADALQFAQRTSLESGLGTGFMRLMNGEKRIFSIPIRKKVVIADLVNPASDPTFLVYDWRGVEWHVRDPEMMSLLAKAVPESCCGLIKGRYLEDDLGM